MTRIALLQQSGIPKDFEFMNTPKILIVVENGCASVMAATCEVEVHIVDKDTQSGFASHEEIGHYNPISDRDFADAIEEHSCPQCAVCEKPITDKEDEESTYCGSMHRDCMSEHAKECEVCKKDFAKRI